MKTVEEIDELAEEFLSFHQEGSKVYHVKIREAIEFAYTKCQEDLNKDLYSEIESLIVMWSNDGTKTAGTLTRKIMELLNTRD